MLIDFAPMEGITGAIYRRLHHQYFPGVDRYYTPFLAPTREHVFTPKMQREYLPEYNEGVPTVPQLLTKSPEDFLWAAGELHAMGYEELNLNLGCPSGTVTAKGKGSGMLADLQVLDAFLDAIFSKAPCPISVKTRLGMENPEEFAAILAIYEQYPISELIVHPRVRKDFYRHPVRMEVFDKIKTTIPLSYNGGVRIPENYDKVISRWTDLKAVMIGQGLVGDPFLAARIRFAMTGDKARLRSFHDDLFAAYVEQIQNRTNTMKRMKEQWFYLIHLFADSEKHGKRLLKTRTPEEYTLAVDAIFRDLDLLEATTGGW